MTDPGTAMLRIDDLTKRYKTGDAALGGVSFAVGAGAPSSSRPARPSAREELERRLEAARARRRRPADADDTDEEPLA